MKPFLTRFLTLGLAATAAAFSVATSHATNLTEYDFTGYATSDTGSAATTTAGMLAATNFAPNAAGFQAFAANSTAGNYMFTTNGNTAFGYQSQTNPATEALSVTDATYYNFTLTPNAGTTLSFNTAGGGNTLTLSLNPRVLTGAGNVAPFTANLALRSSVDNFAATIGTFSGTQATTNGNSLFNLSVDLTSVGTLAAGQAITFRLYAYDAPATNQDDVKVDTVVVNGAAVPEPSTGALAGLGALGLVRFARRRTVA